ncbi:MAG: hypothetical protein NWF05_08000 [Candidatus Bathyarchaeota archaeon]|nr:hypothetical protein [Candidatus Bathyarchaeota archaeon]
MIQKKKTVSRVAVGCLLILLVLAPTFLLTAKAETADNYWVTVKPTTEDTVLYAPAGRNWTLSFEAQWTYGNQAGQLISNATATIEVTSENGTRVATLEENITAGVFAFNYSSSTADILTFNVTKLTMQNDTEWNSTLLDVDNNLYGLSSKPLTIWWDTFHVALLNHETSNLGTTAVTVNVTYLLIPEKGLTLPASATYSGQTFLPKIAHGLDVTINGVKAQETSPEGVYSANVSTWSPTAYIPVGVAQEGWTTTCTGFSFAHNANQPIWEYAIIIGVGAVFAMLIFRFVLFKKPSNTPLPRNARFPVFGSILLAAASIVSLYWGLVGLDGALHGFDWTILALLAFLSSALGFAGTAMAVKKKGQAFVILTVILPLIVNLVLVKTSLEAYQLAIPWGILVASLVFSLAGGLLICNADEQFSK